MSQAATSAADCKAALSLQIAISAWINLDGRFSWFPKPQSRQEMLSANEDAAHHFLM